MGAYLSQKNPKPNQLNLIGNATFDHQFTPQIKNQLLTNLNIQILHKNAFNICNGDFIKQNWHQLFLFIKKLSCDSLWIQNNHVQVFHSISFPQYQNLKYLNLAQNSIANVQSLTFLDMPKLQTLSLRDNLIIELKPINKVSFPKLKILHIDNNPINKIQLNRTHLSNTVSVIFIQYYSDSPLMSEDLSVLGKIQSEKVGSIMIQEPNRIKQNLVQRKLNERYSNNKHIFKKTLVKRGQK